MLELLGSKETSFPQILKDRLHVQLGMSHNPCTFGSYTIQPVPLPSAVKLWHSFRGGQWLPAFSPYFIWATRLSSTHLCNVTTQMLPSPLFFSVVFHSFLQKALLVFPVRSWASVVPIVELCSALFPLCRSLELFSEMRICFQGISHVLKTVIVIKSLKSRTSSHNSESLLWSKQKDLSLEKQLVAKWHLQIVLWYHLPSRPVWLRKWSSVVESLLRTHRLRGHPHHWETATQQRCGWGSEKTVGSPQDRLCLAPLAFKHRSGFLLCDSQYVHSQEEKEMGWE